MQQFLLRDLGASLNSLSPTDRICILAEALLDDTAKVVLDTSKILKPAAPFYWSMLGTGVTANLSTAGTAGAYGAVTAIAIGSGQLGVDLNTAATSTLCVTGTGVSVIPAASVAVMVLIIVEAQYLYEG